MRVGDQGRVPTALPPEGPGTHCKEYGWAPVPVWMENITPTGMRFPDRPARSELSRPTHNQPMHN